MAFCRQCGTQLTAGNPFCSHCGTAVPAPVQEPAPVHASAPTLAPSPATVSREAPLVAAVTPKAAAPQPIRNLPSWSTILSDPKLRSTVLSAIAKSLGLNLLLTALVLIPGIALTLSQPVAGMVWLFVGSFALVARCYAKPWKLSTASCLLPGLFASGSFLVQLLLFPDAIPSFLLLLVAAAIGLLLGWLRSRSHTIYIEDGVVMARRTLSYLVIWAAAYLATQTLAAVGASIPVVYGGLLAGAFSTCMLLAASVVIWSKYLNLKHGHGATLAS